MMLDRTRIEAWLILLAASSALFALSDDSPVKSQNHASLPDVRQIVESSIAATQRHWQVRLRHTYVERDENRRLDPDGRVKSEDVRCLENDSGQRRSVRAASGTQRAAPLGRGGKETPRRSSTS